MRAHTAPRFDVIVGLDNDELAHHPAILIWSRWQRNIYALSGSA